MPKRQKRKLTSEPPLSLPDCSQSSCDDSEDKDTLEAPGTVEMRGMPKAAESIAYLASACACQ